MKDSIPNDLTIALDGLTRDEAGQILVKFAERYPQYAAAIATLEVHLTCQNKHLISFSDEMNLDLLIYLVVYLQNPSDIENRVNDVSIIGFFPTPSNEGSNTRSVLAIYVPTGEDTFGIVHAISNNGEAREINFITRSSSSTSLVHIPKRVQSYLESIGFLEISRKEPPYRT